MTQSPEHGTPEETAPGNPTPLKTNRIVAGQKTRRKLRGVEIVALAALVALIGAGAAVAAVAEIRAGRLEPRPATCGWRDGGCTHPSVCRAEGV